MVKVTFATNDDSYKVKVRGHANYGAHGTDIVCASVSILAYTLAEAVKKLNTSGYLSHPPFIEVAEGRITVECCPLPNESKRVEIVFNTIKMGYRLLADNYPENVNLDE